MAKKIILTFEWDGTIKKETKGFSGSTCTKETKFLEDALGKASNRKKKASYYEENTTEQTEKRKARN